MTKATKPYSNRIALVFDFDNTLVPDTVDSLLENCGIDSQAFRAERIQPLIDNGWEPILARFYSLIQESKRRLSNEKSLVQRRNYLLPRCRNLYGWQRQWYRRLYRTHQTPESPGWVGSDLPVAIAVLPLPKPGQRLRCHGLLQR